PRGDLRDAVQLGRAAVGRPPRARPRSGPDAADSPPRRGLRLRDQARHPAPPAVVRMSGLRGARGHARARGAGDEARRDLPLQRPRRSGGGRLCRRGGARALRQQAAGVRDLPRPPDPGAGAGREDLQAQVRPPRRQPPGDGPRHTQGGDHLAEPRLRGGRRLDGRQGGPLARQPQRQDRRGDAPRRAAGVQRAVPPRGLARAQRRRVSVRPLPDIDGGRPPSLSMIYALLDRLTERYSENEHRLEAMRAREEYFDRAGKVFDDDAELFEGRMASFLEWYVLERPHAGLGGKPPVVHAVETGAKLPAEERRALAHLASSHRSLFQLAATADRVLELEDLVGGARFSVLERRNTAGVAEGDVFEARVLWDDERAIFGR